ncbi:hypothetical protein HK098_005145 [Nowakowskiella sp. JEL0407]|nr:hypothetical protein HK098_005145 [Nowakowskiella sp. JEL0407]
MKLLNLILIAAATYSASISASPIDTRGVKCMECVKLCDLQCAQGQICGYDGPCQCTAKLICIPDPSSTFVPTTSVTSTATATVTPTLDPVPIGGGGGRMYFQV